MPKDQRRVTNPSVLFAWLAPLIYAAFALLTPPFQTPDEHQHLFRAWQLSQFQLIGERRGEEAGGALPAGLGRAALPELGSLEPHTPTRPIAKRPFATILGEGTFPELADPPRFHNFPGSAIYSPAGYIPQIVAIWLGRAAGSSVESIVRLGRLLNAMTTVLLIYCAIRLTPVGALAIFWVGLLPMSASASASFGQDGIVIGGACLLTAIGLRVIMNAHWERSHVLVVAGIAIIVTMSKLIYLPLALIGGQPYVNRSMQWRRLLVSMALCAVSIVLLVIWLDAIGHITIRRPGVPYATERLGVWLDAPSELFMLLGRTYSRHGWPIFYSLFKFGWLNIGPVLPSLVLTVAALAVVLISSSKEEYQLGTANRLWLALIALSVMLLLNVAMYLYWTPGLATSILGLQGRYFIPVMPVMLIAILPRYRTIRNLTGVATALMIAANLFALNALTAAFYG